MYRTDDRESVGTVQNELNENLKINKLKKSSFEIKVVEKDDYGRKWVHVTVNGGSTYRSHALMYISRLDAYWRNRIIAQTLLIRANNEESKLHESTLSKLNKIKAKDGIQ